MSTSKVVVVDLRDTPADLPDGLAGGVVVLDHAQSLVEHAETYMSLIGEDMVTDVVCVAIGEAGAEDRADGAVLTVPSVLRHATVLWVGDPEGVDWAPGQAHPSPVERSVLALDDLVAALRVPKLFDRVVAVTEELAGAAANPGVRFVSGAADPVELSEARAAGVRSLCAEDDAVSQHLEEPVSLAHTHNGREGAVLSGPVLASQADAVRRLNHVVELARILGTPRALFGSARPTAQLGAQVLWAGQAAENYRRAVLELLDRMDKHIQGGRASVEDVVELGVPQPWEADRGEIADELRRTVDGRLGAGAALAALARQLRVLAARSGPQGCMAALDEVRKRGPLSLDMPGFRKWPLRLWSLPLVFVTCAVLAFVLGSGWPGWVGGGLLAAAWFGSGWLLLGRRPGPQEEFGLSDAAVPALVYGVIAVAGVVSGGVVAQRVSSVQVPPSTSLLVTLAVVAVCVLTVVLSWRAAVRRWRAALRVAALHDVIEELTRIAEQTTAREWLPMRRRQVSAAVAAEVAAGLDEIGATLAEAGNGLFVDVGPPPSPGDPVRLVRPVPHELYAVVRGDLADLCRTALEPAWRAAAAGMPAPDGVYAQRLDRLLGEYGADVRRHGLLAATRFGDDHTPRDALMARVWSESPAALAALRVDVDGAMTQLCRGGQLGYLSTGAEPGLVRFAPAGLRRVLEQEGLHRELVADPRVTWGEGGELVGALRLLPLRPESVRQVLGGVR
ncbi:hypothetical protein [Saccharothrix deserti]|uniref:hypothetical protein n=1 Tax=Saccharothrix deserti TaxID=2593674 RepID=UPI00131D8FE8|nr:hypothetical protein [Saccharothrix deserti]